MPSRATQPLWNVLALQRQGSLSLQDQIVAFFRDAVLRGALKPGARLPSSRQLAAELGVARITAVEAFDRLAAEGYFETRRGVGRFVAHTVTDAYLSTRPPRSARARRAVSPDLPKTAGRGEGVERLRTDAPTPDALPLATGVPALEQFPWRDWARISARVYRERPAAALAYGDPQGLPELRSAIADYLGAARAASSALPIRSWWSLDRSRAST